MTDTTTQVKERPILFSTPMVKGILADLKDITRRTKGLEVINQNPDDWEFNWFDYQVGYCFNQKSTLTEERIRDQSFNQEVIKCPYGLKGDILWVRETWRYSDDTENPYEYKATFEIEYNEEYLSRTKGSWKPSIHMPKVACRTKLEVLSIRPERLHDITEEDAIREGIEFQEWEWGVMAFPDGTIDHGLVGLKTKSFKDYVIDNHWFLGGAKDSFETLWQSINGKESLDVNPWVWRIEFKKL